MIEKINATKPHNEKLYKGSESNALTCYMNEISKIKPLTRDEELELGRQIAKGDTVALQKLVKKNLKYVVSVANKYRGCGLSLQDVIEEGNVGLIQAAKRFDPSYGVKLITYAVVDQASYYALPSRAGKDSQATCQAGR